MTNFVEGETLCFIEVKARLSDAFAGSLANVNLRKQRQVTRTAQAYKQTFALHDTPHRFDVVTVLAEKGLAPKIDLFRGFWNEAKFKKCMQRMNSTDTLWTRAYSNEPLLLGGSN